MWWRRAKPVKGAELRGRIEWIEADGGMPFRKIVLDPTEPFSIEIVFRVSLVGDEGGEIFDLEICNPARIVQLCADDEILIGHDRIVVNAFDPERIERRLREYVATCTGSTPAEVYAKVARVARAEFDPSSRTTRRTYL